MHTCIILCMCSCTQIGIHTYVCAYMRMYLRMLLKSVCLTQQMTLTLTNYSEISLDSIHLDQVLHSVSALYVIVIS